MPGLKAAIAGVKVRRSMARDSAEAILTNVLIGAMGLASGSLLGRLLGPSGRGELAVIQSWPLLLGALSNLGVPEALVYHGAKHRSSSRAWVKTGLTIMLVSAAICTTALWVVLPWALPDKPPSLVSASRTYSLIVIVMALGAILPSVLRAQQRLRAWNVIRLINPTLWLLLVAGSGLLRLADPEVIAFAQLIAVSVLAALLFRLVPHLVVGAGGVSLDVARTALAYGLPVLAASVPQMLNMRLDQALMAAWIPQQELGLYVSAVAWASAATPLFSALGAVLFPRLAGSSTPEEAHGRLARVFPLTIGMALVATLLVGSASPVVIPLLFGESFRGAIRLAMVLSAAAGVQNVAGVLEEALKGLGRPRDVMKAEWYSLAFTIAGLSLLVPMFGAMGAAATSCVANVVCLSCLLVAKRRDAQAT